ncbi:protein UPSTREAM OF FLC-like isoform X2 [Chenopodium quinoa]|nr:protein UPSTREAM OF FLC-like isoform X2 [Chenopodium quinoa]
MAVTLSRGRSEQLHLQKIKEKQEDYINDQQNQLKKASVVPVVYYLSRNGQLEHPHFMEVPLSSSHGLFLSDVIHRLYLLRGKSMPSRYSWSSKRSYKSGYVWHDLAENDFIHPVHGGEYVLKGSEILVENTISSPTASKSSETTSSSSSAKNTPAAGDSDFPAVRNRRRNQSWGAIDLHEYKVYKTESTHEFAGKAAADASTQTDEKRRRRKAVVIKEEPEEEKAEEIQQSTELSRDEISPPPSDSSPETLELLMKADGRLLLGSSSSSSASLQAANQGDHSNNQTIGSCPSGRMKASTVLMSLISCGSISFKDCGAVAVKDNGFSLVSHYKTRVPRGTLVEDGGNEMMMVEMENNVSSKFAKMALEDKEYFSGSLIETTSKKQELPTMLKRSSSYNADR